MKKIFLRAVGFGFGLAITMAIAWWAERQREAQFQEALRCSSIQ